jgi:glycine betaine/proline transport system permease protein
MTALPPDLSPDLPLPPERRPAWQSPLLWAVVVLAVVALTLWGRPLAPWAFAWPKAQVVPFERWIGDFVKWLQNEATFGLFTFREFTRFLSWLIAQPYDLAKAVLSDGRGGWPALPWVAVTGLVALIGLHAGGWRLAALSGGLFALIAVFGQWTSAMVTLASILIAVPIGVLGGLALGLAAHRWRWLDRALAPVLDLMQTMPVFAYLVPILILFGFSPVAAIIATVIYALPPMTRITLLALARVPGELRDLGRMVGCSRRQMTWKVMVPSASEALMVGVNQVIMLSLNMVIIASMIGAGGLGFDVLTALRRLDFGAGLEAGLAIVALAIVLDRLSQALARKAHSLPPPGQTWLQRHPYLGGAVALVLGASLLGLILPPVQTYPAGWRLTTGDMLQEAMRWINVTHYDTIEGIKNAVLLNLLIPVRRFLIGLPWLGVVALLVVAGWRLGGWRLAALCGVLSTFIAAVGLWEQAMITVYLCGISVIIATLIGLPIALLVAERERLWNGVRVVLDTLQTLPSFVYLMPFVMLFRVGDFTAMLAVVAYAISPAIRYAVLGLQGVDPRLIEAGRAMGATKGQILTRIKLKLALPEILLGLNQTIMFALSMLVITALVGTRDLGQEVYIALTRANAGHGIVAGLCVAFIAIIADRLIQAGAARARTRLGLSGGRDDHS